MIYLSGAMSCFANTAESDYPYLWRRAVNNQLELYRSRVKTFNPTIYYNYDDLLHYSDKEIMRFELGRLKKCKVVLLDLYRFNQSDGTKCEVMSAYNWGIPIIAFGTPSDYEQIHPWFKEMINRAEINDDTNVSREAAVEYIFKYYYA